MALIGYHCSHEQFTPSELLSLVSLAHGAGFRAAMCSDHFNPWSERQGQSGFAWSWLGAATAGKPAAVRRCQCSRAALPPDDCRAGCSHAGRDVSAPLLDGDGQRPVIERAHHRRRVAPEDRAPGAIARMRGDHSGAVGRRDSHASRSCPSEQRKALHASFRATGGDRSGGFRRDRRVGRELGGRTHHGGEAPRRAGESGGGLPAGRWPGKAHVSPGADELCRDGSRSERGSLRSVAAERAAIHDPDRDRRSTRVRPRRSVPEAR